MRLSQLLAIRRIDSGCPTASSHSHWQGQQATCCSRCGSWFLTALRIWWIIAIKDSWEVDHDSEVSPPERFPGTSATSYQVLRIAPIAGDNVSHKDIEPQPNSKLCGSVKEQALASQRAPRIRCPKSSWSSTAKVRALLAPRSAAGRRCVAGCRADVDSASPVLLEHPSNASVAHIN